MAKRKKTAKSYPAKGGVNKPKKAPVPKPASPRKKTAKRKTTRKTATPAKEPEAEPVYTPPNGEAPTKKKRAPRPKKKATPKKKTTAPKKPAKKRGRPRTQAPKKAGDLQRARAAKYQESAARAARDIAEGFATDSIDWIRRLRAKEDPEYFAATYLPRVFYLPPSEDHKRIVAKARTVFMQAGKFSLAMPRGQGKTAWCRAFIIWGTAYGWKRFPFFIGSTQPKATQTLDFIKTYWYRSSELRQDFPEIAYPIYCLENRHHLAKGQLFNNESTHIEWGSESIRYPCLLLSEELAAPYLAEDPDSLLTHKDGSYVQVNGLYIPKSAGTIIRTAGIDGSIRGEAEVHPITLEQPRPDLVLLDDIQKDQKAESPAACEKLERLIDGAIDGLSGPDELLSCLMPCTVTREGDISDTYLDRSLKPDWKGERCSMVVKWPDGLSDYETDLDTPAGFHWNRYAELRKESLHKYEDIRLATAYYVENRDAMDSGFIVSWEHRYNSHERYGHNREVSAIQHAMNLRIVSPYTFPAEYQNKPKTIEDGVALVSPAQLAERTVETERGVAPGYATHLVAFIDVQNEAMYYLVLAVGNDFTGVVVEYGTYPVTGAKYYRKGQFDGWSLLTRAFFKEYPEQRAKATKTEGGKLRAPFEAKIYYGLQQATKYLLSREYPRADLEGSALRIEKLGIDARWGKASDAIKRFVHNQRDPRILCTFGHGVTPAHKQYEEYTFTRGWLFESQVHPGLQECKWIWRPGPDGYYYLAMDVNRLKTFAMSRLACPLGSPGAIALHSGTPEDHELIAEHIAGSEYPEPVTARGRTKDMWQARDGRPDNDYLDSLAGCIALASMLGVRVNESDETKKPVATRRSLSELWKAKRGET